MSHPSANAKYPPSTIYHKMQWKYGKVVTHIDDLRGVLDASEMRMFNGYTNGERFTNEEIVVQAALEKITMKHDS